MSVAMMGSGGSGSVKYDDLSNAKMVTIWTGDNKYVDPGTTTDGFSSASTGYKTIGTPKYGLLKVTHGFGWNNESSSESFIISYGQNFRILSDQTYRDYKYDANGFWQGYTGGTYNKGVYLGKIEGIVGTEFN